MRMDNITILSSAWTHRMHDYACMIALKRMMIGDLQTEFRSGRQNIGIWGTVWLALGHIFAKVPLLGMPPFEDTSRPSLKAGSCETVRRVLLLVGTVT